MTWHKKTGASIHVPVPKPWHVSMKATKPASKPASSHGKKATAPVQQKTPDIIVASKVHPPKKK